MYELGLMYHSHTAVSLPWLGKEEKEDAEIS